jgi:hypothetical protein
MPIEESLLPNIKDVIIYKDFYIISCLSLGLDYRVKAYLHNNTVKVILETLLSIV